MTFNTAKELSYSAKNFLAIIEPATIVTDWTLVSGTVYYNDFGLSDEFLEYVSQVSFNGVKLNKVISTPSSGEYYWNWDTKRLYINVGANPSTVTVVVFFEIYFGTKSTNTYRDPMDSATPSVYFAPRISDATIPQVDRDDLLVFGTNQGSVKLINLDAAFYIYDNASFKNKTVKIYHFIDSLDNVKLVYSGKIEDLSINDERLSLSYRQVDYIFNNSINSYLPTGSDSTKGFINSTDFPNVDPNQVDYCARIIYGCADDINPINIDYSDTPSTTNNRDWVVRSQGSQTHQLNNAILSTPSSTVNRAYIGAHFFQIGDAIEVDLNTVKSRSFVTAIGSDYIDVSPALSAIPSQATGDYVDRSTIGYVRIRDEAGDIHKLMLNRDFTETVFANNTLGFTLTDNFETSFPAIGTLDPQKHVIFCRCYGKKHATVNDSVYGNLMAPNLVIVDILENYLKLTSSFFDKAGIEALSSQAISFCDPVNNGPSFSTYRDIFKKINISVLGNFFVKDDTKLSYFLIGPMGASTYTITDKMLLSLGIDYDGRDIYNIVRVHFDYFENVNGSGESSNRREFSVSSKASYLHEVENEQIFETLLKKRADAVIIADRYRILYEDFKRIYSLKTKLQLADRAVNDIITIERTKLTGYNFDNEYKTKKVAITSIKKSLTGLEIDANDQKNIEDNTGDW